jgi:hypothetical protein
MNKEDDDDFETKSKKRTIKVEDAHTVSTKKVTSQHSSIYLFYRTTSYLLRLLSKSQMMILQIPSLQNKKRTLTF